MLYFKKLFFFFFLIRNKTQIHTKRARERERERKKYLDTVLNGDTGERVELGDLMLYVITIHTFSSATSPSIRRRHFLLNQPKHNNDLYLFLYLTLTPHNSRSI